MSVLRVSPAIHTEWQIPGFKNLPKKKGCFLRSPTFSLSGALWWINIYPNGDSEHHNDGKWVSVYLHKKRSAEGYHVSITIGIKKADGVELTCLEDEATFSKEGELGWGKYESVERSTLKKTQNLISSDGSLTVFCNLRILDGPLIPADEVESQTSSSTTTTQTPLPDTILKDTASQTSSSTATTQTPLPDTILKDTTSQTSSLNSVTGETSLQSPSLDSISTLVEDLKNIYISRNYSDVTILVQNKMFYAHRNILGGRSAVFASMFEHEFAEKINGEVEISDCDPDTFEEFLLFLYIGKVDDLTISKAVHLCITADKYDVKELKEECVRCMVRDMSIEYVCDTIRLAMMLNNSDLLKAATDYFINNVEVILPTPKWQQFLGENPVVCNELLIKVMKSKK